MGRNRSSVHRILAEVGSHEEIDRAREAVLQVLREPRVMDCGRTTGKGWDIEP